MRTNLAIRPSVKNSSTNWFGPVGWARIATGVHATLPRTTAFAGSSAGDIQMDRGACTPGLWYVWSASIRFVGAASVSSNIDWYNGASSYILTTNGNDYDQAGGTTLRIVSGVGQAPPDAATIRPNVAGFDGGAAQITGLLIEEYTSEADATAALAGHATAARYFDGDGDGVGNTGAAYAWTGTNGSSTSTTTAGAGAVASVPFAPMGITALGRREIAGLALVDFGQMRIATGLIATAVYDPLRGRVRVKAVGLATNVVRAVVSSRVAGTGRWAEVRGGRMAVVDGAFLRPVDDYEYRSGSMEYRIIALASPENSADDVVQTKIIEAVGIPDVAWLKFIASPYLNRRIRINSWSNVARKSKNATYSVRGRVGPISVTDVHDGRSFTVELVTTTVAERDNLDAALALGAPVLFQAPDNLDCPTMYATIGDYDWRSLSRLPGRHKALFTIPLTEATAPPPSIVGVGLTWATVVGQYATWQELTDSVDTWLELLS